MDRSISFRADRARPGTWLERGLALAERLDVGPAEFFVADPQVTLLGLLAIPLLHLGLVEQARARAAARTCPRSRSGMADGAAGRHLVRARCSRCGSATPSVSPLLPTRCTRSSTNSRSRRVEPRAGGFAAGRTPEWAQPRDGYRRIREAYEDNTRLGMLAGASEILGYADGGAGACRRLGWQRNAQLEEALQVADKLGERVYLPQLFLMEAAIARARGDRAAADASIRRAIAEARAQEAPWLELMALIELCDRHSATAKDRRALAALVDQLPEALNTPAAGKARALLDKTQSA